MKTSLLIATFVLFTCAAVFGQARTAPRMPTSSVAMALDPAVATLGRATVTADFNGDGKMDIASTNNKDGGLTIRLGKGDGTFLPAVTYRPGYRYNAIVLGDFNGDGKLDLAVSLPTLCGGCGGYPSYQLQVFLGAGDGTFTHIAPKYPFYGLPLAAGDFNGDGKLDLLVTSTDYYGDSWIPYIVLGNGDGTFHTGATLADDALSLTYPAVGDFNGDGKLDIALPITDYYEGVAVDVLMGNGDGTFTAPVSYPATAFTAVAADMNGDGKLDIVTDGIQVLLNNGDGTFTTDANVSVDATGIYGGVAVGDFNGDGKIDFAVGGYRAVPATGLIFLGNNDGTFQQAEIPGAWILQAANFSLDGKLDLLTYSGILLQTPASLTPIYLDFGYLPVNTKSTQTVTLTNVGNVAMTIKSLSLTGSTAFTQTNNCGKALASGKSCQIQGVFAPTTTGPFTGSISVTVPGAPASTMTFVGYGQ
jgi:FG-GAP-like repeat/Abnormal spindle-like microcephaly-assoc'd, ASPM-SPD-2-Hydin